MGFNWTAAARIGQIVGAVLEKAGISVKGLKPSQVEAAVKEALSTQKKLKNILKPKQKPAA